MPMSHPELPDELQGSAQPRPESDADRLMAIGQIVAKKRDEAVKERDRLRAALRNLMRHVPCNYDPRCCDPAMADARVALGDS